MRPAGRLGIVPAMLRHSTFAALLWLLAIALLPVRLAQAHLHMCLDGQDAPVAVHVDIPTHHGAADHDDEHTGGGHNDVDVDVSTSATVKKAGTFEDLSLDILGVYVLALVLPEHQAVLPPSAYRSVPTTVRFELLPPSRGPPSLASH